VSLVALYDMMSRSGGGVAVRCYERCGAGVVLARRCEAGRISLLTIPCRKGRDSTNQVTFEWCFKTGKAIVDEKGDRCHCSPTPERKFENPEKKSDILK